MQGSIVEIQSDQRQPKITFTALSYTWLRLGPEPTPPPVSTSPFAWEFTIKPHDIIIDDSAKVKVSCNVYAALVRLRSATEMMHLFVDALSIDQGTDAASLEERSRFVKSLHNIYKLADKVIVDLGDYSDGAVNALDLVRYFGHLNEGRWIAAVAKWLDRSATSEEIGIVPLQTFDQLSNSWWTSLIALCQRPWWKRIWCLQEILLAKGNAVFMVNSDTIDQRIMLPGLERIKSILPLTSLMASDYGRAPLDQVLGERVRKVLQPLTSTLR